MIGRLQTIYPLTMVLLVPLAARLADRWGQRSRFVLLGGLMAGGSAVLAWPGGGGVWPLALVLLGLGVGIIVSALTTKYRDLAIAVSFGVQLWMYISPVVYPLSSLEESPRLQMLMRLNPMTAPIEVFRMGTLGTGTVEVGSLIYSLIVTAAALVLGVVLFSRIEKTFMDTV